MSEYYVTHSKYKRNNAWENCLTYKPDTTLAKSNHGTYTYYHCGQKVWDLLDTDELFVAITSTYMDYLERIERFPVFRKYSEDCQSKAKLEYNL